LGGIPVGSWPLNGNIGVVGESITNPSLQLFIWPGVTEDSLNAKPFHIYNDEFYDIIGDSPTLTLLAQTESDPLFHEAVVW
jgi:gluconolactonase